MPDMTSTMPKLCTCGSGEERYPLHDARGIFCAYVCSKCEKKAKAKYRPEIFKNENYYADEPIDPEQYYEPEEY